MNFKSNLILLVFCMVIFLIFDQHPCHGTMIRLRNKQEDIMRQAEQQTIIEPKASREIKNGLLEIIETPTARPDSPLLPIKEEIGTLLEKEEVRPEEIAGVREKLDNLEREGQIPDSEREEYDNLKNNINIAYEFTNTIDKLKKSKATIADLNNNFKELGGQYNVSFYGNLVLIVGMITKLGYIVNWKLDRKLKRLDIDLKKVELNKHNVNN